MKVTLKKSILVAAAGLTMVSCKGLVDLGLDKGESEKQSDSSGEGVQVSVKLQAEQPEGFGLQQAFSLADRIRNVDYNVQVRCANGTQITDKFNADYKVDGDSTNGDVYDHTSGVAQTFTLDAGCVTPATMVQDMYFEYSDAWDVENNIVQTYTNMDAFPVEGQTGIYYYDTAGTAAYTWNGTTYVGATIPTPAAADLAWVSYGSGNGSSGNPDYVESGTEAGFPNVNNWGTDDTTPMNETTAPTITDAGNDDNVDSVLTFRHDGTIARLPIQDPTYTIGERVIAVDDGTNYQVEIAPLEVDVIINSLANAWCSDITVDLSTPDSLIVVFALPEIGTRPGADNGYNLTLTPNVGLGGLPTAGGFTTDETATRPVAADATYELDFTGVTAADINANYGFDIELHPNGNGNAEQQLQRCSAQVTFRLVAADADLDIQP